MANAKNYLSKIPLGNNKFAYEQVPEFKESGLLYKAKIEGRWTAPEHFYHLKDGGHVAALTKHLQNDMFSKIDLSRFFYRVTKNKIIRSLKRTGLPFQECLEIAADSVVKTENCFSLLYGFVQSPLLASIALHFSGLGKFLTELPSEILVSVYVDDIILSSNGNRELLQDKSSALLASASKAGFPTNSEKCELVSSQIETFNVKLSNQNLWLTDDRMVEFHGFLRAAPSDTQIQGVLGYVGQINQDQMADLGKTAAKYK